MAGAEPSGNDGVRRRRSGHYEDSDSEVHFTEQDALDVSSTTLDSGHVISVEEQGHRVRFSEETGTRTKHKSRRSHEIQSGGRDGSSRSSRAGGMSLDIAAAQAHATDITGEGTVKSPTSTSSPKTSPRSRVRGLSLRSSLFAKHMGQQISSSIELRNVRSREDSDSGSSERKKNSQTSVTVTPVAEHFDEPPLTDKPPATSHLASALPNYQRLMAKHSKSSIPLRQIQTAYDRARKLILRIQEIPPSKDGRHISFNPSRNQSLIDERTGRPYVSNLIRSSKYTTWNFLPRQLFAQFSKLANFYFLCVSILQMIPGLSTTGTYTTIIPLMFFVSLSMAKEGYEDLRRHRLDKAENNRQAEVLRPSRNSQPTETTELDAVNAAEEACQWVSIVWQDLQVGDVVKLHRDEAIPADMLLLGSKGPNNTAYVETMALDGETNLKPKQPIPDTVQAARSTVSLAAAEMHLVVEDPGMDLYNFEGKLTCGNKTFPLTNNEIIYRGSVLRNTPEVVGILVYSGEECKIRMNANKNPRIKAPALQSVVNKIVFAIVLFVLFLALVMSIAYQVWQDKTEEKAWYIENAPVSFGPLFTSFIIMFNTMIPLSLYVSLEIIKVAQMVLMNSDVDLYDSTSNTPFEARTSTINEELGQVAYVFSDKTGTLTENVMRFRKLSVAGHAFLHDADLKLEPEPALQRHESRSQKKGKQPVRKSISRKSASQITAGHAPIEGASDTKDEIKKPARTSTSQWRSSALPSMLQDQRSTQELVRYLQRRPHTAFAHRTKMMILSIALCHTCLPERSLEGGEESVSFQSSSPDELALVDAAKDLGYLAYERDASTLVLRTYPHGFNFEPTFEKHEILDTIEFSSRRKRMSVVVRTSDGRIAVICKGADSVITKRLRLAHVADQKLSEIEKRTMQRKSMEAQEALRRKSSLNDRSGSISSIPRTSNSLARRSATMSRSSIGRLEPIRDDVNDWLSAREHDVDESPRVSSHIRNSMAISPIDRQGSFSADTGGSCIVDESVATDESLMIERCLQHVNDFATEGLRTLLYGYRFLDEDDYRHWRKIYHDATTSLVDRQSLIEKAGELIEQNLELGGATAIEDKLQQGVPETIDRLRRANIKMWMLTGDKRETAINIGHSCRLIKDYSSVTVLDYEAGDIEQNIASSIIEINRGGIPHSVVVIDGQTLTTIETDAALHVLFLDLAILADSVVCCRASPSQKASLVNAIRTRIKRSVTLAIGDGANDIAMIQEAHVGIGITGKEGLQAARTSDYSIAQFRFLAKLLLVHGRWNYIRTCKYTVGTFWKEMLFYLTQALYQRFNGYSGTSLYESWSLSMFNTLFTSLTIIFLGIFEQDLRPSTLIAVPELYTKGQRSAGFNLIVYLGWMATAAAEANVIFWTMWGLYGDAAVSSTDLFPLGNLTFTACVVLIAVKLQLLEQRYKSVMAAVACVLSVGGWFLWNIILAALYKNNNEYDVKDGLFQRWGRSALWWLVLVVSVAACCLLEIGIRAVKAAVWPTEVETFQTLEGDVAVRRRFEEASTVWLQAGNDGQEDTAGEDDVRRQEEQAQREAEVQELLDRPRTMEEGRAGIETEEQAVLVADGPGRASTDLSEMLSRRYGNVKRDA